MIINNQFYMNITEKIEVDNLIGKMVEIINTESTWKIRKVEGIKVESGKIILLLETSVDGTYYPQPIENVIIL